jgi:hypothetical protein
MKRLHLLTLAVIASISSVTPGSEPGEPITWGDTVVALSGLMPGSFLPRVDPASCQNDDSLDFLRCARSFPNSRQDAEGNVYAFKQRVDRSELWRTRKDGEVELVAHIPLSRPAPGGCHDVARFQGFFLEPFAGEIYVRLASGCSGPYSCCLYSDGVEVYRINGLKSAAEVVREQLNLPPGIDRRSR